MAYVKIRPRRGTASAWEYANPILAEGEMAFEVPDTGVGTGLINIKQGDGQTAWVNLPYAFNAGTLNDKVDTLSNTVATYDARIRAVENSVDSMEQQVKNIRKIDIQTDEPRSNLDVGQIWINNDIISGTVFIADSSGNKITHLDVNVGAETFILTLTKSGGMATASYTWESSDSVAVSISSQSDSGCKLDFHQEATNVRVTATAWVDSKIVYTTSITVTVSVAGVITVSPKTARLIIGKGTTLNATLTSEDPDYFSDVSWISTASYFVTVTGSEGTKHTSAHIKGIAAGTATIYGRALKSESYVAQDSCFVTVVGMSLDKQTASIPVYQSETFYLYNTMEQGIDYSTIEWKINGSTTSEYADITGTDDSCIVVAKKGGYCELTANALDQNGELVQQVTATIGIVGAIEIFRGEDRITSLYMQAYSQVAIRASLATLAPGTWDRTEWSSSDNTIVSIVSNPTDNLNCTLYGAKADTAVVYMRAYLGGNEVASASIVVNVEGSLFINSESYTIAAGQTIPDLVSCTNSLNPNSYDAPLRWYNSDPSTIEILANPSDQTLCTVTAKSSPTQPNAIVTVKALKDGEEVASSSTRIDVTTN